MADKEVKMTPKQASRKAESLISGINNSVAKIDKEKESIVEKVGQLQPLLQGLSNAVVDGLATKSETKSNEGAKPKNSNLPVKKSPKAKKAASASSPTEKALKKDEAEVNPPKEGRPSFKDALIEVIRAEGPMSPADARKRAVNMYGYWSTQNLYSLLKKDTSTFKKVDGLLHLASSSNGSDTDKNESKQDDSEVESFVNKVKADETVSQTV